MKPTRRRLSSKPLLQHSCQHETDGTTAVKQAFARAQLPAKETNATTAVKQAAATAQLPANDTDGRDAATARTT